MMKPVEAGIFPLRSTLHDAERGLAAINELVQACKEVFPCRLLADPADADHDLLVIPVMTGGTESSFLKIWPAIKRSGKALLLAATGSDNSLPAALEILSWLKANEPDADAAIVHGSHARLASQIRDRLDLEKITAGLRTRVAGIIGEPSEWLIASMPDPAFLEKRLGIRFVTLSMDAFARHADKAEAGSLSEFARIFYKTGECRNTSELARAAKIYGGLIRVIKAHGLNALTLRCFDILTSNQTTGCLALAKLNDDGIPAACEGDVPAMLTMMVLQAATGKAGFMANPSSIAGNQVIFAHCTCPLSLLQSFSLPTHFESGIGLAVAGEFAPDTFTLCRLDFVAGRYALASGRSLPHAMATNLCRTQLKLDLPGASDYFFSRPLGNHHVLVPGDHTARLQRWCRNMSLKPAWQNP